MITSRNIAAEFGIQIIYATLPQEDYYATLVSGDPLAELKRKYPKPMARAKLDATVIVVNKHKTKGKGHRYYIGHEIGHYLQRIVHVLGPDMYLPYCHACEENYAAAVGYALADSDNGFTEQVITVAKCIAALREGTDSIIRAAREMYPEHDGHAGHDDD